jgi:hypothetical protein
MRQKEDEAMQDHRCGTAMALLVALGVGFGATQALAQACDVDGNGYVSADEAAACTERDYSAMVGDEEAVSREQFEEAFPASENVDEMWAEADANGDGQLSRAEWSDWSAQRFRSASPRVEGLSVDDYEALEAQYHMGDDQQGRDESGSGPGSASDQAGSSAQRDQGSGDSGASGSDSTSGSGDDSDDNGSGDESGDGDSSGAASGGSGDSDDNGSGGGSGGSGG